MIGYSGESIVYTSAAPFTHSHPDGEDPQPMETGGEGEGGSKARELERLNDGQPK